MIDFLNLLLISRYASSVASSSESVNHWLKTKSNYDRLQHECEKIWSHYADDPAYDAERAFKVLGKRLAEVCRRETQPIAKKATEQTIHN